MRRPPAARPARLAALAALACTSALTVAPARADVTDGTLSVTVAVDVDADGSYDPGLDGRQPGILVTVADAGGGSVSGATDEDGRFVVEPTAELAGGRYFVTARVPDDLAVVPVAASGSFAPFSSAVDVSGGNQAVLLAVVAAPPAAPAASDPTARSEPPQAPDARGPAPATRSAVKAAPRYAVGDRVWSDADGDGRQDDGEGGLAGVSVQLLADHGRVVGSTTSDGGGRYLFDDLSAGTYAVRFAGLASGSKLSPAGVGGDAGDSDPDYTGVTPSFTLAADEPDLRPAAPRDGVRAEYLNATVDAGVAPLRFAIASLVWRDLDRDGLLDPDEPAGSARVLLLRGAAVVATTTTDDQGRYRFSGLPGGWYRVRFADLGAHRVLTRQRAGTSRAVDSAPHPRTSASEEFRLGSGTRDLVPGTEVGDANADFVLTTLNAGTVDSYSIRNRVWRDVDGDGVADPGEPGVAGVRVELLDAVGDVVSTTRTTAGGRFSFDRLPEGQYRLRFPALPPGLHFTTPQAGEDPTADSDVYGNAVTAPISVGTGHPAETEVAAGLTTSPSATAGTVAPAGSPTPAPVSAATALPGSGVRPVLLWAAALLVAAAGAGAAVHARRRRR